MIVVVMIIEIEFVPLCKQLLRSVSELSFVTFLPNIVYTVYKLCLHKKWPALPAVAL